MEKANTKAGMYRDWDRVTIAKFEEIDITE